MNLNFILIICVIFSSQYESLCQNLMNRQNQNIKSEKYLCAIAFDHLIHNLKNGQNPNYIALSNKYEQQLKFKSPLFVTWHSYNDKTKNHDILRGCIGNFEDRPITESLLKLTISSSQFDDRFVPISENELFKLQVTVSLLGNFDNKRKNAFDWEIGKHGVIIQFQNNGKQYQATFLPDVIKEQKWDHETTLYNLILKTGYKGVIGREIFEHIMLTTYETSIAKLQFNQYQSEFANIITESTQCNDQLNINN